MEPWSPPNPEPWAVVSRHEKYASAEHKWNFTQANQKQGSLYDTNPNNALLQGKSLRIAIHLHCLIPSNGSFDDPRKKKWAKNAWGKSFFSQNSGCFFSGNWTQKRIQVDTPLKCHVFFPKDRCVLGVMIIFWVVPPPSNSGKLRFIGIPY